jgi:thioredoxin-like negative regulator of GroEL
MYIIVYDIMEVEVVFIMVKEIQNEAEFHELTKQGRVMVEFYASWCPDCHRIDPYLSEWESKYSSAFTLIRANRDNFPEIAEQYNVLGIPTFLAFEDGKEKNRLLSRDAKSKSQVEQFLDKAYE